MNHEEQTRTPSSKESPHDLPHIQNPRDRLLELNKLLERILRHRTKEGSSLLLSEEERKILSLLRGVILETANLQGLETDEEFVDSLIEESLWIVDVVENDSIASRIPKGLETRAKYYRESGIDDHLRDSREFSQHLIFMTPEEFEYIKEKLQRQQNAVVDPKIQTLQDIIKVINAECVLFNDPNKKDFARILTIWEAKAKMGFPSSTMWVSSFRHGPNVIELRCFCYGQKPSQLYPRSELPQQTVNQGIIRYATGESTPSEPQIESADLRSAKEKIQATMDTIWQETSSMLKNSEEWRRVLFRKYEYLRKKRKEGIIFSEEEIARPAKEHYQREFGENRGLGEVDVIITRSGVSANEIAKDLAIAWTRGNNSEKTTVAELPGWYFENSQRYSPDEQIELLSGTEIDKVDILLATTEPNPPLFSSPDEFYKYRNNVIISFARRAQQEPNRRFALVIDKTTDPDFQAEKLIDSWPPNLRLIETVSLSKHQRGGRNYFYGLVLGHGTHLAEEEKQLLLIRHRGTMTREGWIGMAKITKRELVERRKRIFNTINRCIAELKEFLEKHNIIVEPYGYYFFLREKDCDLSKKRIFLEEVVEEINDPTIEIGDSFGLSKTRVTRFDVIGWQKRVFRISPGEETDYKSLKELVIRLAESLTEK